MLNRRAFLLSSLSIVLATPLVVDGQPADKVYRLGLLVPGTPAPTFPAGEAFWQGMRDLGWIEGQNLIVERRWAEGKWERLPNLAVELVRLKVNVIVAFSTASAVAAKKATSDTPIVMVGVTLPVERGLIASLARPGGNATGLTGYPGLDFTDKQFELLKEAAPRISRVAYLRNGSLPKGDEEGYAKWSKHLEAIAQKLGMSVSLVEVRDVEGFPAAFARISDERADALLINPSSLNNAAWKQILDLATAQRLPTLFGAKRFVEAGGLMSYWTDWSDVYRRSASFVDRILRGASPADLPVEHPSKFELVINLKTARTLGLTIPPALLLRADEVIE